MDLETVAVEKKALFGAVQGWLDHWVELLLEGEVRIMRKQFLCGVAAVAIVTAISGPAGAADLRVPAKAPPVMAPACTWCGFYVGVHLGAGWSRWDYLGTSIDDGTDNPSGLAVGVHAGYNWQFGQWVLGIEGDGTITPWERSSVEPSGDTLTRRRIDWLASLRGRLGWAFDRTLIYATGGVAWTDANTTQSSSSGGFRNVRLRKTGGVVGGGIEWKYTPNVSLRAEGLHYIFNKQETSVDNVLTDKLNTVTVVRAGASWHFGP